LKVSGCTSACLPACSLTPKASYITCEDCREKIALAKMVGKNSNGYAMQSTASSDEDEKKSLAT
jgi:hypothetical protein